MCSFLYRYASGIYFSDCNMLENSSSINLNESYIKPSDSQQLSTKSTSDYSPVNLIDESQRGLELDTIVIADEEDGIRK